jgi:hypothetical protein
MPISVSNSTKCRIGTTSPINVILPNFYGTNATTTDNKLEKSPEADTVIVSSKTENKKCLYKNIKTSINITMLSILLIAEQISYRRKYKKLTQFFSKELKISNLPENIKFNEAKTLDEALKFAKETLGIKHIDKNFTLEMLNYVNKGIVDVSNANKGKFYVPKKLLISTNDEKKVAFTVFNMKSPDFGSIGLSSKHFTEKELDKFIYEYFKPQNSEETSNVAKNIKDKLKDKFVAEISDDSRKLLDKFLKDSTSISLIDKIQISQNLNNSYFQLNANQQLITKHPIEWLKNFSEKFKEHKIDIDFDKLKTLSKEVQLEEVNKLVDNLLKSENVEFLIIRGSDNPYHTLYHEIGHLQDVTKNLERLEKERLESFNLFKIIKKIFNNKLSFHPVADHWGGATYEKEKELIEKSPKKFKFLYPNLHKHLNNSETQRIVSYTGGYAMTSIGEFIAETYSLVLSGHKLPKEVIELYKKYGGPMLPGM